MNSNSIVRKLAILGLFALVIQSCGKRTNGIDNNNVITKPYSLYVCDSFGNIFNTNDGINYKMVYPGGGLPQRAITTADSNLIYVGARDAFYSPDFDGDYNFNVTSTTVSPTAFGQSMILSSLSLKRVFLAGTNPGGVLYSDSSGKPGSWKPDTSPAIASAQITSFTQLASGTVVGYDDASKKTYTLANTGSTWASVGTTGTPLPATGKFFVSHISNRLVAADANGVEGVYYSDNNGAGWTKYNGLPANTPIYSMNAPFDQVLLVGTTAGIYKLKSSANTFEAKNDGIHDNAIIRGIVGKDVLYKNGKTEQYIYLASSKGVYISYNLGDNWVRVFTKLESGFVALY